MYASILLALAPISLAMATTPTWHEDYGKALKAGRAENKPVAVILGSGKDGWKELLRDGELPADARKLMAEKYVCLYVDGSNKDNQPLLDAFNASSLPVLIVSNRTRDMQAYRQAGKIDNQTLASVLQLHAGVEEGTGTVTRSISYQPATRTTTGTRSIQYCPT